jgi:Zn-dependent protease with chaperone function
MGYRRRRMETVAVTGLIPVLLLVPFWLVSLGIFWLIARIWIDVEFWWFPLGWSIGGLAMFLRPVQVAILTPLLGARRPTATELAILAPIWTELTRVLDLPDKRYVLRVLPAEELNAFASGGHLVVVTTYAIEQLEDRDLAGVLAHELSHHLGMHTVALTLGHWLSLPIMIWAKVGFFLHNVAQAATDTFAQRSPLLTALGDLVALILNMAAWVFLASLHLSDAITNHFSRAVEYEADRRVVIMGYGPQLATALSKVSLSSASMTPVSMSADSEGPAPSWHQRLASSHPPARTRMARIEAMLRQAG